MFPFNAVHSWILFILENKFVVAAWNPVFLTDGKTVDRENTEEKTVGTSIKFSF